MVFRCNLDGSEMETLGWNFRNNYEWHRFLRYTLAIDNDDDGKPRLRINYVMEFATSGFQEEMTGCRLVRGVYGEARPRCQ